MTLGSSTEVLLEDSFRDLAREAWRKLSLKYHPDKTQPLGPGILVFPVGFRGFLHWPGGLRAGMRAIGLV